MTRKEQLAPCVQLNLLERWHQAQMRIRIPSRFEHGDLRTAQEVEAMELSVLVVAVLSREA